MDPISSSPPPGDGADRPVIVETSPPAFLADVIEPSKTAPVFVYFWAPNPACQQFTPLIERIANEAGSQARLAKINVQIYPEVSQQLQLQTIPSVLVFQNGAPVNGFTGPIPEEALRQFFSRVLGAPVEDQTAAALEAARNALDAGDPGVAQAHYSDILGQSPENGDAIAGIIETFLALDDRPGAKAYLEDVPEKLHAHPAIASMRARLELSEADAPSESTNALLEKLAKNPEDHAARYDLAMAQFTAGNREEAIKSLLDIIRKDREWNDNAARTQLLKFFEAIGQEDPLTQDGRRQLSSILFA